MYILVLFPGECSLIVCSNEIQQILDQIIICIKKIKNFFLYKIFFYTNIHGLMVKVQL